MLRFSPPELITLHDYQADAIDALRRELAAGRRRVVLCAATGAGKTIMAAHLLSEAAKKGKYAFFLVDRVALVDQVSEVLDRFGIIHGVIQGDNVRYQPFEYVQVCSVQTLHKRILHRTPDLILYDECHCTYRPITKLIGSMPDAVVVGLTATPFTSGMGLAWDGMVNAIPTRRLIEKGFLVEPTIYVARSPDEEDLAVEKDEFSDLSASAAGIKIVGDVVTEWIAMTHKHFGGPAKTIVFSPTVEHGRELCAAFRAAGYNFQQVSYLDRDDDERARKIAEFRRLDSEIHGLVSCGVLTKGFDVPDVLVGISCKPYRKSLSSHMQEIGRVMRTHPGKDRALWLDHSGNIERFATDMFDVWDNGPGDLDQAMKRDSTPRKRDKKDREQLVCRECGGVLQGTTCTVCGWERPARSNIHALPGELVEFTRPAMMPRAGLRSACLEEPRAIWDAAVAYCTKKYDADTEHARKWAYAIWHGIYPEASLPKGWFNSAVVSADPDARSLIEREVRRFRKTRRSS